MPVQPTFNPRNDYCCYCLPPLRGAYAVIVLGSILLITQIGLVALLFSVLLGLAVSIISIVWPLARAFKCDKPEGTAAVELVGVAQYSPAHIEEGLEITTATTELSESAVTSSISASASSSASHALAPLERYIYMDNLKSALTIIVLIHHVIGAFTGGGSVGYAIGNYRNGFQVFGISIQILNQSWFMCFFFFISAYFTPTSYDRKGPRNFMFDKFYRLGIPFVVHTYILGPLVDAARNSYFLGDQNADKFVYAPNPGPTWFLFWLLIFNSLYCLIQCEPQRLVYSLPSLPSVLSIGLGLGFLQGIEMIVAPFYIIMPVSFGSLPFDCVFFFAGVLASRNKWLGKLADLSQSDTNTCYLLVLFFVVLEFSLNSAVYASGGGLIFLSKNSCGEEADRGLDDNPGYLVLYLMLLASAMGKHNANAADILT